MNFIRPRRSKATFFTIKKIIMFRKVIVVLFVFELVPKVSAQLTISAETGINIRPYVFEAKGHHLQLFPDPFLGLSLDIAMNDKLTLLTFCRYIHRKTTSYDHWLNPRQALSMYKNQDFSFGIGLVHKTTEKLRIGYGVGAYHKLNAHLIENRSYYISPNLQRKISVENRILINAHLRFTYSLKKIDIFLMYEYLFMDEFQKEWFGDSFIVNANLATSIGITYPLYKSKTGK
jgi:hypothetical protein